MATAPAPERSAASGTMLIVALVLVLAWQLAYWTWAFVAPPASRTVSAPAATAIDLAAIARLFGASAPATSGTASLRLKGVVAPTPGVAASAIFAAAGARDLSVFVGHEVQPGVKLSEVYPDHVVVTRAGIPERIDLETFHGAAPSAAAGATRGPGFHLNVGHASANQYSFSRKELDDALRDPGQLAFLGQIGTPIGGGVRMEAAPPGSLASKLGLQTGDVIRRINGQTVASQGDLARLYQQFGTLSQIDAEVQRGSATVRLSYQIR